MARSEIKNNNLFVKGIVVDTNDPKSESRLKIRIPCYHGSEDEEDHVSEENLPWAQTCLQKSNVFDIGNTVWVTFEGGDTRYPIVLGQLGSTATFADENGGSSCGSFGIVGGEYDITIDGVTYHIGGTTLAEYGVCLIKIHECGSFEKDVPVECYQAINGYDVNGPSIGLIQWHNSNAIGLLKRIREKNSSNYDKLANDNNASSLISDLTSGTDWHGEHITKGSSIYNGLKAILGTTESIEVQNEMAAEFVQSYIDLGIDAGITDNGALLYHADICNQGPYMKVCSNMRNSSDKSLDNFYNISKNEYYERRTLSYKIIKELQNLGALEGTGGVLELPSGTDASYFLQILRDVWKVYVDNGNKWDYSYSVTHTYSIRGKSITTRTDCSGYCSAAIMVLCQETGNSYGKEVNAWRTYDFMPGSVKGFQKLKYKYSDLKAGDIVVRQEHMQAIGEGYPNVKIFNCGGKGFASKGYNPSNWWEGTGDDVYTYIFRIIEGTGGRNGSGWVWPVPSCKSISSPYGYRTFNGGEFHKGIDIPGAGGSAIVAARDGVVEVAEFSGRAYSSNGAYICGGNGYGNCTVLNHGDGYYTLYGHQSSFSVKKGQKVSAGQRIGAVGNTGASFGNHLHFEVRKSDGTTYDPQKFVSPTSTAKTNKNTSSNKGKNGKTLLSGSWTATYYGNYSTGSSTKGGSGRVLSEGYSCAINNNSGTVKLFGGSSFSDLYNKKKEIYIECDDCPEINGTYRIDDAGAGSNNIDIYYVKYSNVPSKFKNAGRVKIKVYV